MSRHGQRNRARGYISGERLATVGRELGQRGIQRPGRGRRRHNAFEEDVLRGNFAAIKLFVRVPVLLEHLPVQRDTRKGAARARVGEDLGVELQVRGALGASRPTGPPAAEASAPILVLSCRSFSAPRPFITSRTKSVAWPPSWKPTLTPPTVNHGRRTPGAIAAAPANHAPRGHSWRQRRRRPFSRKE